MDRIMRLQRAKVVEWIFSRCWGASCEVDSNEWQVTEEW